MFHQQAQHVAMSAKNLHQCEMEGNTYLQRIVICDEMLAHYFTSELKQSSME
jgi:hypothetical protein